MSNFISWVIESSLLLIDRFLSLFFFFFFLVDRVSIVIAFELARSSNLFAHCPRTYKKILRDFTSETGNFQYLFLIERLLYIIYIYIFPCIVGKIILLFLRRTVCIWHSSESCPLSLPVRAQLSTTLKSFFPFFFNVYTRQTRIWAWRSYCKR